MFTKDFVVQVKLVPLSGTGKHKYSFQRVEIPTLPINFCDCEEHSICHHTAKEKQTYDLETQSGGINEEELNVMNSVMNKLLERENISNAAHSGLPQERENSVKSGRELQFDKTEADSASDEDNLIINAVTRRNHRMGRNHTIASMGSQVQKRVSGQLVGLFLPSYFLIEIRDARHFLLIHYPSISVLCGLNFSLYWTPRNQDSKKHKPLRMGKIRTRSKCLKKKLGLLTKRGNHLSIKEVMKMDLCLLPLEAR